MLKQLLMMSLSIKEKVKKIVPILAFSIILPTIDVGTDLRLIIKFSTEEEHQICWNDMSCYTLSGIYFSIALLIPFISNYLISWISFVGTLKFNFKKIIFPLLNVYPQYNAVIIILQIWKNPQKGLKEKRKFERIISLNEALVEAIPTTLILTLFISFSFTTSGDNFRKIYEIIIGVKGSSDEWIFYFTYGSSLLSAGFGLAKCLKVGAAANMGEGGPLDGLLSAKFIVLFLSSTSILVFKAALIFFSCEMVKIF